MAFGNFLIPLADTLLFAVLATIGGALWRAQRDTKRRLDKELSVESQKQIATVQARFLDRFAEELFTINAKITGLLRRHQNQEQPSETVQKTFNNALTSSEELQEYLSGIKHYALTTRDADYRISPSELDLPSMLSRILKQFESMIETNQIEVVTRYAEPSWVWSDEILLEPILFNLISNAIKYSPRGAQVHIRIEPRGSGHLQIEVQDEGPGIDPALHEKIFAKFYRIQNDQVFKVKGNGLGLFLCRFFADQLGTPIQLESELGKGACFRLLVPKARSKNRET